MKAEQILFDKRMRAMYVNGTSSYIDIILSSNGIDDFISRLENVTKIITFDQNIINDLQTKETSVNLKKVELNTENTKLLSLRVDNKKKLVALTKQKSDQNVLVAQLNAQENKYGAQLVTDQATEVRQAAVAKQASIVARQAAVAAKQATVANRAAAVAKQITAARQAVSAKQVAVAAKQATEVATKQTGVTPNEDTSANKVVHKTIKNTVPIITASTGRSSVSSNAVIAYASNFLGIPYVWGGTSPSGFDCSGFTQYVFAHFGVNLPRVSEDQQNVGTFVSRANLQPGDLVFFGTPAHHVGIYVGNGNMINAPHTGAVIRIQALNSDFTYGRRVN